jgi:hypothetical protein
MNINADHDTEGSSNDKTPDTAHIKTEAGQDIHDSQHDQERMKEEVFTLDLPDVQDIPGQEHVHVLQLNGLNDVTISSDDEEGVGLFDNEDDIEEETLIMGNESDVKPGERKALRTASEDLITHDNTLLREAALDNRDGEGDELNEGSSGSKISGKDLDVSGAEEDNADEEIGEEDEENNDYSLGGDDHDEIKSDEF